MPQARACSAAYWASGSAACRVSRSASLVISRTIGRICASTPSRPRSASLTSANSRLPLGSDSLLQQQSQPLYRFLVADFQHPERLD